MESEPAPSYSKECIISIIAKQAYRDFPGGPLTLHSQRRGPGFHLWSEREVHPTHRNYGKQVMQVVTCQVWNEADTAVPTQPACHLKRPFVPVSQKKGGTDQSPSFSRSLSSEILC